MDVEEKEQVELNQNIIYLRIEGDFTPKRDIATFYYSLTIRNGRRLNEFQMRFDYTKLFMEVSLPSLTMQQNRWEVMSTLITLTTGGLMIGDY